MRAFLDDQVARRQATEKKEKDAEIIWKIFDEELLERQQAEDAEKIVEREAVNEKVRIAIDEQVALVKAAKEVEKERVRLQDVKMLERIERDMKVAAAKEKKKKEEEVRIALKVKADVEAAKRAKEEAAAAELAIEIKRAKAYTKLLAQQEAEKAAEAAERAARSR